MATKGTRKNQSDKSAFDIFDEVDNTSSKKTGKKSNPDSAFTDAEVKKMKGDMPFRDPAPKKSKPVVKDTETPEQSEASRKKIVADAKKEIEEKVAASKKSKKQQPVVEETPKKKSKPTQEVADKPKGKIVAASEKGKTVTVEAGKVKKTKSEDVDNKEDKRTKREEQKAEVQKFETSMTARKGKYHIGQKPMPKTASPDDFKWKPVKEVEGVNVQRNTVFKCVHPLTVFKDYPDTVFDPRGTGLELVRVKSLDNICEAYEEMFKVNRKEFLKDAKNKKRFPDAPETEYYSVCSDRRFMHATSWGSNSKNLVPADKVD